MEIAKIQTHQKLVVPNMLQRGTANTSTWWQIAKNLVNYVKEEVQEIAKMCKKIVENGLNMGFVMRMTLKPWLS